MGAEIETQRALKMALSDAGLTVYDFAPQAVDGGTVASPYVEIGWNNFADWDTFTETGFEFIARLHTRSRSNSSLEAKTVQATIYTTLHRKPLAITGQTTVLIRRENSDCTRASDGTFHGVCEYRGLIQAT